ncbi:MAG: hypothetical protein CK426_06855 [Legionella sp.]|nr:MAG: hypothetical protein CK423_02715 [Legionella sp.]PJD98061.1 MAG: hypothetical protein CK426_06855 [Legionella sp.]
MATIRQGMELLLNPFFLLLLLLVGSVWLIKKQKREKALLLLIGSCCLLMGFSTGWLPRFLTTHLETANPIVQTVNPDIHWVVVLGGGHSERSGFPANDLLTQASIKRLIEGVRLFRALPKARLILSGGGTKQEFSEAALLAQLSHWFAIPSQQIILEDSSSNTQAQAKALAAIVGKEPFYLVTSAIHMPRAVWLCQQQGLHPIAAPTDYTLFWQQDNNVKLFIPNAYNVYYFNIAMHELLGQWWARWTAGLDDLPRSPS